MNVNQPDPRLWECLGEKYLSCYAMQVPALGRWGSNSISGGPISGRSWLLNAAGVKPGFSNSTAWMYYFRPSFIPQSWRGIGRVAAGRGVPAIWFLEAPVPAVLPYPKLEGGGAG